MAYPHKLIVTFAPRGSGWRGLVPGRVCVLSMRARSGSGKVARYLSIEETAEVLGISDSTVKREWRVARAWLLREMHRAG